MPRLALLLGVLLLAGCHRQPVTPQASAPQAVAAVSPAAAPGAPAARIQQFARTSIPLPPGDWVEVARDMPRLASPTAGRQERRMFAQLTGDRVVAVAELVSTGSRGDGFPPPEACTVPARGPRTNDATDLRGTTRDYDCDAAWPTRFDATADTSEAGRQLAAFLTAHGGLPHDAFVVLVAAGWGRNSGQIRLSRFPEADGQPGWQPSRRVESGPARVWADRQIAWAVSARPELARGVRGRL